MQIHILSEIRIYRFRLKVFLASILCLVFISASLKGDGLTFSITVSVEVPCYTRISYIFPGDEKFIHVQGIGLNLRPQTGFQTYNVNIPTGISGLRILFYGNQRKELKIKNIMISNDSTELFLGPNEILADFYWERLRFEEVTFADDHIVLSAVPTEKGLGATNGTLRFTSARKLNQIFNSAHYNENTINVKLKTANSTYLKILFSEEARDIAYYYEFVGKYIESSDQFGNYEFEILTSGEITGLKLDFGTPIENQVSIDSLVFSSNVFQRDWNGRKLKKYFEFNSLISEFTINNKILELTMKDTSDFANPSMTLNLSRLVSEAEELFNFYIWLGVFVVSGIIFSILNKYVLKKNRLLVSNS